MLASMNGHAEVVDTLLQHGAGVDFQNVSFIACLFIHASQFPMNTTNSMGGVLWRMHLREGTLIQLTNCYSMEHK